MHIAATIDSAMSIYTTWSGLNPM